VGRFNQNHSLVKNFVIGAMTRGAHDCRIIVLFDTGSELVSSTQLQLNRDSDASRLQRLLSFHTGIGSGNKKCANHAITLSGLLKGLSQKRY